MGDTMSEIEAGLELFMKYAPFLFQLFGRGIQIVQTARGVSVHEAAQIVTDHLDPSKPFTAPELADFGGGR